MKPVAPVSATSGFRAGSCGPAPVMPLRRAGRLESGPALFTP